MRPYEINQLVNVSNHSLCLHIITKITAKTIFLKPCMCFEKCFSNDIPFQTNEPTVYQTYLPNIDPNQNEIRILKRKFNYNVIDFDILGRVYRNEILQPETVFTCEAFCNTARLEMKHRIKNTLDYLDTDERPRNAYHDSIKLREILKLREEFQAEPVLYYVLTNELTNEHNVIYADRPQLQKKYLDIFQEASSPANLASLGYQEI